MSRRDIPISESQSDALYRRDHSYTEASGQSFRINWQWDKRQPRSLRDAADMIRRAYAEEVPSRLHNRDLADDGTPKMTPQAESYIFGGAQDGTEPRGQCTCQKPKGSDPEAEAMSRGPHPHLTDCPANRPILDYYRTPFRAALDRLDRQSKERGDLIAAVATGQLQPMSAAIDLGVPAWAAKIVAEDVIFAFMRSLSDLKISLPAGEAA